MMVNSSHECRGIRCPTGERINWQVIPHRNYESCSVLATAELDMFSTGCTGMPYIL